LILIGTIIAAHLNAPGSWHDSRVAKPIYEKLLNQTPPSYYLVADTAFPRGVDQIQGRIRAPIKAGSRLTGTREEVDRILAFDRQLLSYRQTAEWGNRRLQGSFGRLRVPLEVGFAERWANVLEICVRGYCLRAHRAGPNQIRTVYMPQWQANVEDVEVWESFENMLFSEQRRMDRVSRFHTVVTYE
jgi:hypothetical protein